MRRYLATGLLLLIISTAASAQVVKNYFERQTNRLVIGYKLDVVSAGVLDVKSGGFLKLDGTTISSTAAELNWLAGLTAGTVTASKAVVVDGNKDISAFRNLNCTSLDAGANTVAGSIDIFPAGDSKGKLSVSCANQTGNTTVTLNANAMGQATQVNIADPLAAASYIVQSTAAVTLAEANVLDGATAGAIVASKAVVVDANSDIGDFRNLDAQNLDAGANTVAGSVDIFPAGDAKGKLTVTCANQTGNTAVTLNANAMGQATQINIADPLIAASYLLQSTAAVTVTEANLLDGAVAGTAVANKCLALGANKNVDTLVVADSGLFLGAGAGTAVTSTATELNTLDGAAATLTAAELNILDGVTADATEINVLDGATAGAVVASKAVVASASSDVSAFHNIGATGKIVGAGLEDSKAYWCDDFEDEAANALAATTLRKLWWTGAGTNGTQSVALGANGLMVLATSATAQNDDSSLLYTHENYNTDNAPILEAYVKLSAITDVQTYLLGFYDDASDYVCFEFDSADDANHISVVSNKAAGGEVRTDTTIHLVAGTYVKLRLEIDADEGYRAYINDALVKTGAAAVITQQTTNQPYFYVKDPAVGHPGRSLTVDYIKTWQNR